MKKEKVIYPMIDPMYEKRIDVSTERLLYGESEYYFSPKFKLSNEILEGVVRGYISQKGRFGKIMSGSDLIVFMDFSKEKVIPKIKEFLADLKKRDKVNVPFQDVLGFFQNGKWMVILTSKYLYSQYGRDDYKGEEDPKGYYVKTKLKYTSIENGNKIISDSKEVYVFEKEFTDNFIGLFEELKELNKSINSIPSVHPLNCEKREVRENYLAILIDETLMDGNLSANEVVRLEIIARQIGIDSITVIQLIKNALSWYKKCDNEKEFINYSLKKMDSISKDYYYMLYHDLLTFELLSKKGEISEQLSEFTNIFAKNCGIEEEFCESYKQSMQKLVVSSYSLRNTLREKGGMVHNQKAFENLCKSVEYEYNLQKELLQ